MKNPLYDNAPFELSAVDSKGRQVPIPFPKRFSSEPTSDVWLDPEKFNEWAEKNSVPPFIGEKDG